MASDQPISLPYDALTGYQRTAALKTAIDLDVFTSIGEGTDTIAALAARCQAAERGIRALCNRLLVDGLLTRDGERYALSPTAATFLDRRSPVYVGSAATFLTSSLVTEAFARLTEAVRRGGTAIGEQGTLSADHPIWVEFARSMAPVAGMSAMLLANALEAARAPRWRVLDIAAGHGMFGISLARENPNATVFALDWRNVLAVAEENATAAGVRDRFQTIPGSAFEVDWGTGYDLVLLPNFLHHFDPPTCEQILRRAHAALVPGGRVVIVEFIPDDDRSGPPEALSFALVMLATTPAGDAYTFAEYEKMLRAAGFSQATLQDLRPSPNRVIIARR
jgi:2-polyprenyl-3-methyl-5-hydroxy-6-metoxy-1,4-benzoquinol methylase